MELDVTVVTLNTTLVYDVFDIPALSLSPPLFLVCEYFSMDITWLAAD